jgi:hypothetical protein
VKKKASRSRARRVVLNDHPYKWARGEENREQVVLNDHPSNRAEKNSE